MDGSTEVIGSIPDSSHQVAFGENLEITGRSFDGEIEEVRIWSGARTGAQVRETMHLTLQGDETDLVGYWQFNDGSGTVAEDSAGENDGALTNMDESNWTASTVTVGSGTCDFQSGVQNQSVMLGNVIIEDTADPYDTAVDLFSAELALAPNLLPSPGGSDNVLEDRYWVVHGFTDPGVFSCQITFTLPVGYLDTGDAAGLRLYNRAFNDYGAWSEIVTGASDVTATTVTFDGVDSFGQFTIGSSGTSLLKQPTPTPTATSIPSPTPTPFPDYCCWETVTSFPYTESFESGLGYWLNSPFDDADWEVRSGRAPGFGRPPCAQEGYYYLNYSYQFVYYVPIVLQLDGVCFDLTGMEHPWLTFRYSIAAIFGGSPGLKVAISEDECQTWTTVCQFVGDQGGRWNLAAVDLSQYTDRTIAIRFLGDFTSAIIWDDIAVDNILVEDVTAPGVTLTSESETTVKYGPLGGVRHVVNITNCGFQPETFHLDYSGGRSPILITDMAYSPLEHISVAPYFTEQFRVVVLSEDTDVETVNITAESMTSTAADTAALTGRAYLYYDDFANDVSSTWTFIPSGISWEWGTAVGSHGCHNGNDPDHDYTGEGKIVGFSIGNCVRSDIETPEWGTSPSYDFTGFADIHLVFMRWLTAYDDDHFIEVYDGEAWNRIWEYCYAFCDTEWTECVYDISEYAAGSDTRIRFGVTSGDSHLHAGGMNFDSFGFTGVIAGYISGTVTDTQGAPITGATVRVIGEPYSDITESDGAFTFACVPGSVDLIARRTGYKDAYVYDLTVYEKDTTFQDVSLPDIYVADYPGHALDFDGDDDYVAVSDEYLFDFTDAMTIEAWIRVDSFSKPWQAIITKGDNAWRLARYAETDMICFSTSGLSNVDLPSAASLTDGQWHHVAGVYDGAMKYLYINGVADASTVADGNINTNDYSVMFGENGEGTGRHFDGKMDEVRIWCTARTADRIRELMHLSLPIQEFDADLVGYWQFNEGSGDSAVDCLGIEGSLENMDASAWIASTVPIGNGTCVYEHSVQNRSVTLGNVVIDDTWDPYDTAVDIFNTEIGCTPNLLPSPGGNNYVLEDRYWVDYGFSDPGTFSANITLTLPTGYLETGDAANLALYHRPANSDGSWSTIVSGASDVTATTVTFDNVNAFGQFTVGSSGDSPLYGPSPTPSLTPTPTTTVPPTEIPQTPTPIAEYCCLQNITEFPYHASFESGLGAWNNSPFDDLDWIRRQGTSPIWPIGPSATPDGDYYLSVYSEGSASSTALLDGVCLDLSVIGPALLTFNYYMYVDTDQGLYVDISEDDCETWNTIWLREGSQGDGWNEATINLCPYEDQVVSFRFRAATVSWDICSVAVDGIGIEEYPVNCFELNCDMDEKWGSIYDTVAHVLTIANCGSLTDTYTFTHTDNLWPVQFTDPAYSPITEIQVDPCSSADFLAVTTLPSYSGTDSFVVSVSSDATDEQQSLDVLTRALLHYEDFTSDPTSAWTLDPAASGNGWQWGAAVAGTGCMYGHDPDYDVSGEGTVLGYEIGGCYPDNMSETEWLYSPIYDFSDSVDIHLVFQRWLGVDHAMYDNACLEVYDGSAWHRIWENTTWMEADHWECVEYDIAEYAAGPDVQIRFGMGPTNAGLTGCGWSIDSFGFTGYINGYITGTVTDSSMTPINGAAVTVNGTSFSDQTGPDGTYTIPCYPGNLDMVVIAPAYVFETASGIAVSAHNTTVQNFVLQDSYLDQVPGTALDFDGVDDYAVLPNEAGYSFTDAMTVEAWIRVDSFTKPWQAIVTRNVGSWKLMRYNQTDNIMFYTYGLSNGELRGYINVNDGQWHHVAAVYDGQMKYIYIDGVLDVSIPTTGTISRHNYPVTIGENIHMQGRHFDGKIDEVRLWNTGRTGDQVREYMHRTFDDFQPGLVGYWQFNEGSGSTSRDSATGLYCTLENMDETSWITSTVPCGSGTCDYMHDVQNQVVTLGNVTIDDTGNPYDYAVDLFNNQLSLAPNILPAPGGSGNVLPDRYWVDHGFTDPGEFSAEMTFSLPYGCLDPEDAANLILYHRGFNSDDEWMEIATGAAAVTETTVTFDSINSFGQFTIGSTGASPLDPPTPTATTTPSETPTVTPTGTPTVTPTTTLTETPTNTPTATTTDTPTNIPTVTPTDTPTTIPTPTLTFVPTVTPTLTAIPTAGPIPVTGLFGTGILLLFLSALMVFGVFKRPPDRR